MSKLTVDEIVTEVAKFSNIAAENQKNIRALATVIIAEEEDNFKTAIQTTGTNSDVVLAAAYLLLRAGQHMHGSDNKVPEDVIYTVAALAARRAILINSAMIVQEK